MERNVSNLTVFRKVLQPKEEFAHSNLHYLFHKKLKGEENSINQSSKQDLEVRFFPLGSKSQFCL